MNKSESIANLVSATIEVMKAVKGIEKNLNVGTGQGSYKGVADQDVKKVVGEAMERNGLSIFPIDVEETTDIDTWDETNQYGTKRKQSVFVRVKTTYLLCHSSGEYIEIKGIGHGVDSQDKGAGKATTYALKYALLYTFMIPTGKIDDADVVHSETIEAPAKLSKEEKALSSAIASAKTMEELQTAWASGSVEAKAKLLSLKDKKKQELSVANTFKASME